MEPNSVILIVLLLGACALLLFLVIRLRPLVVKIVCAVVTVALAMLGGMAVVNDYFGYYQSWSAISADLSGSYSSFAETTATHAVDEQLHGRLENVDFDGQQSGIHRDGLVYLPPQYFRPRYAHTDFPVVELLHGTPGSPSQWVIHLQIVRLADELISKRAIGPMVLVMPATYSGRNFQECVGEDDTYISQDVPTDVMSRFRVSPDRAEWGVGGFSSGGYCAANLALRHHTDYGAAGIMDGYYRPQDGEAAAALGNQPAAEAANDPLAAAQDLQPGDGPLPSFWVSAGTGVAADIDSARHFVAAVRRVESVPFDIEPRATHNFYAWQVALPHLLSWMWTQLAPPALRMDFPSTGKATDGLLPVKRGKPSSTERWATTRPGTVLATGKHARSH